MACGNADSAVLKMGTPDLPETDLPKLCLAASGGGHVRQLLDLEELWADYPHVFVTEDTPLGRSISEKQQTEFVPHFALGQARLGRRWRMWRDALRSIGRSYRIVARHRPDIVITTGAGSQLFIVLWARLRGARIVLIDSFARFERPSAFARLAGFLAHIRIAQARATAENWQGAVLFDPLRRIDPPLALKRKLAFATVGASFPFPRLTRWVLDAKRDGLLEEDVILQAGDEAENLISMDGVRIVGSLAFDEVHEILAEASLVICHGGTGSLITALHHGCAAIAVPRRFSLGEHYDEHQMEIAESFATRGLIQLATDTESFRQALTAARTSTPVAVTTDYSEMIAYLRSRFAEWGFPVPLSAT
jgi:UDP-N-acetylglucosamine--N-acetylmuramyl-(pentapeptide) pyrophosphoryl-undecaprenol N-acetylglucosamine transferase